ncbi:hypothetical protein VTK26DRAFT_1365 [Humicola hyalothermophila]
MRLLSTIVTTLALAQTPLGAANPSEANHDHDTHDAARHPQPLSKVNRSPNPAEPPPPSVKAPVGWDKNSLVVLGIREMLFSGEFHPFRLPVPSLWWDVLEKIRALGLNTVSFFVPWALHEGKPGEFTAQGIFDLTEFFDAAKELGLWLIAKPGPYINAEVSGGGLPGWIQRLKGHPRTADADFLAATNNYAANIAAVIAKAQVVNGGRVVMYQPESQYTMGRTIDGFNFPDPGYMDYVEGQARRAGIVVPFINNDCMPKGVNAPGTGVGQVDIYANSLKPLLNWACEDLAWNRGELPTKEYTRHLNFSASTPYALSEFQASSLDWWNGTGFKKCEERLNQEYSRVFYKQNYAAGATILNLYMIYGGTNWGNLGYDSGYTSNDQGAPIAEDRSVAREKYSELKLQAHFFKVSTGYLTATPDAKSSSGDYCPNKDITVTGVLGQQGSFFIVRHTDYKSHQSISYTLTLPTSRGKQTIPYLGGNLTLSGRDSKIHVTDYRVDGVLMLYCTAEIFTWQKYFNRTVMVVYGDPDETHEIMIERDPVQAVYTLASVGVLLQVDGTKLYAQWRVIDERRLLRVGDLIVYMINRNSAYNYWVTDLEGHSPLIINGSYLVRSASLSDSALSIRADFNQTTSVEIIGVPEKTKSLLMNGVPAQYTINEEGNWVTQVNYKPPSINLPDLTKLEWKYLDSLPELQPWYDDSAWPNADRTTNNTFVQAPLTPTSLYASDYGFHTGAFLLRGHFIATGFETAFNVTTQGGTGFASAVWLNSTFLGSWPGQADWGHLGYPRHGDTYPIAGLKAGAPYVLTVLIDNMGFSQNTFVGGDYMKNPRGIIEYRFFTSAGDGASITWKITGNIGGEDYADRVRGPLNEGGLYAERQGYHQPGPPADKFAAGSPYQGINKAGVAFYTAQFNLDLPSDKWDIPLRFEFPGIDPKGLGNYRALLYVNGYQFGRYIAHIGPQSSFPVPEGILNYKGANTVAVVLWATQPTGARISPFRLAAGTPVLTGRRRVVGPPAPVWSQRPGAY